METRTFEGRTEEEAVEAAAETLGHPVRAGEYRLVESRKGFWGVQRKVVIELDAPVVAEPAQPAAVAPETPVGDVSTSPSGSGPSAFVAEVTREIVEGVGLAVEVGVRFEEGTVTVALEGQDSSRLTSESGELLSAIDYLVGKIALRQLGPDTRVVVDAAGFRDRRAEELGSLARRAADAVRRSGRKQMLPPLTPSERRLVHLALAGETDVTTESEGDGFRKRVGVLPNPGRS